MVCLKHCACASDRSSEFTISSCAFLGKWHCVRRRRVLITVISHTKASTRWQNLKVWHLEADSDHSLVQICYDLFSACRPRVQHRAAAARPTWPWVNRRERKVNVAFRQRRLPWRHRTWHSQVTFIISIYVSKLTWNQKIVQSLSRTSTTTYHTERHQFWLVMPQRHLSVAKATLTDWSPRLLHHKYVILVAIRLFLFDHSILNVLIIA